MVFTKIAYKSLNEKHSFFIFISCWLKKGRGSDGDDQLLLVIFVLMNHLQSVCTKARKIFVFYRLLDCKYFPKSSYTINCLLFHRNSYLLLCSPFNGICNLDLLQCVHLLFLLLQNVYMYILPYQFSYLMESVLLCVVLQCICAFPCHSRQKYYFFMSIPHVVAMQCPSANGSCHKIMKIVPSLTGSV